MSYGVGSAVVLLVTDQNLILQTAFHGWNVANARPASGQAAATPPSSVMNSRRLTRSPRRRGLTRHKHREAPVPTCFVLIGLALVHGGAGAPPAGRRAGRR